MEKKNIENVKDEKKTNFFHFFSKTRNTNNITIWIVRIKKKKEYFQNKKSIGKTVIELETHAVYTRIYI